MQLFEEFLQTIEDQETAEPEKSTDEVEKSEDTAKDDEEAKTADEPEAKTDDKTEAKTADKPEAEEEKATENGNKSSAKNFEGLTLLMRSNRKQDLMLHITGKNIGSEIIDKIKDFFENGAGKDCNVKSLYCKTIIM